MKLNKWLEKAFVRAMRTVKKTVYLSAAGVIVEKEGKFLLVQEGSEVIPEMQGKWNFPMGRIVGREKPYKRAMIDSGNETGLMIIIESRIRNSGKIRPYHQKEGYEFNIGILKMFIYLFEGKAIKGEIVVPPHLMDVRWLSFEEIEDLKKEGNLINPYILAAIADYKELIFLRMGRETQEELKKN